MTTTTTMKTTKELPAKSLMTLSPVLAAILITAASEAGADDYQVFLTSTVGGPTELRVQNGLVDTKIKLIVPTNTVDYSAVKIHSAKIEVHGDLTDVPAYLQNALITAGIEKDQIVELAIAVLDGYPLISLGEAGVKIAELLSEVEVTSIALDCIDEIRTIADDLLVEFVSIFEALIPANFYDVVLWSDTVEDGRLKTVAG